MTTLKKNVLSFLSIVLFLLIAAASKVNKIHMGAFNYNNPVENESEKGNYLVKKDGTKVYGNKIKGKYGLLVKDFIAIDDQKFSIPEISSFMEDNSYYGRVGKKFIKRIVKGKINVYVMFTDVTTTSTSSSGHTSTRSYTRTDHYAQIGDAGEMEPFGGQNDIKKLVADCPLAVEMIDKSSSQMRKAIKANRNYMNDIFNVYNNGCKEVTK